MNIFSLYSVIISHILILIERFEHLKDLNMFLLNMSDEAS